jgi:arsenate reductase
MTNVLFVCVANSGRSVIAERLFRRAAEGRHQARSAGSDPGTAPHPQVVEALKEIGIDASDHVPHKLDSDALAWADIAVSTCSEEVCPVTPGVRRLNWHLPDPARADRPATAPEARSDHGAGQPQEGASWTVNSVRPRHLGRTDPRTQDSKRYESYDQGRTLSDTDSVGYTVPSCCAHRAALLPQQRRSASTVRRGPRRCPHVRSACQTYPQNLSPNARQVSVPTTAAH